jgi:hypothetical protein
MVLISYFVYPLSLCDKNGEYFLFLVFKTGNAFPNRSSVFVLEWPNGVFVSIYIGYILDKTKTLYVMVAF